MTAKEKKKVEDTITKLTAEMTFARSQTYLAGQRGEHGDHMYWKGRKEGLEYAIKRMEELQ